jgi:CubicO group peptidase (beta-lactamase class C family)
LAAHVAGPLGADFHIGLPPSEFHRVANVVPPPANPTTPAFDPTQLDPNSVAFKTWTNPPNVPPETSWTEGWRRADIGAGNGHGNARSVARLQSAVACSGEVDGKRLLSPQTIDRIFETQSDGIDLVIGVPLKFGIGYSLPMPEGRVCAWGGAGGSTVIIDADRRITFAYVMNKMAPAAVIAPALAERVSDIVKR